jgi:hypothetical protein
MDKRVVYLLLMIFLGTIILSAQNVFIWDRDDGNTIMNPEDPWTYVGLEYAIVIALTENGITPVIDTVLPDDLSNYDILFVILGPWCEG